MGISLTACANQSAQNVETPQPTIYDNLRLKVSPETSLSERIYVREGALIHVIAEDFTPNTRLQVFLGAPGTPYKDPAATGSLDAEGKTSAVFSIPKTWDDGKPVTQDELLIIVEAADGEERVTLKIGYLSGE